MISCNERAIAEQIDELRHVFKLFYNSFDPGSLR